MLLASNSRPTGGRKVMNFVVGAAGEVDGGTSLRIQAPRRAVGGRLAPSGGEAPAP